MLFALSAHPMKAADLRPDWSQQTLLRRLVGVLAVVMLCVAVLGHAYHVLAASADTQPLGGTVFSVLGEGDDADAASVGLAGDHCQCCASLIVLHEAFKVVSFPGPAPRPSASLSSRKTADRTAEAPPPRA